MSFVLVLFECCAHLIIFLMLKCAIKELSMRSPIFYKLFSLYNELPRHSIYYKSAILVIIYIFFFIFCLYYLFYVANVNIKNKFIIIIIIIIMSSFVFFFLSLNLEGFIMHSVRNVFNHY